MFSQISFWTLCSNLEKLGIETHTVLLALVSAVGHGLGCLIFAPEDPPTSNPTSYFKLGVCRVAENLNFVAVFEVLRATWPSECFWWFYVGSACVVPPLSSGRVASEYVRLDVDTALGTADGCCSRCTCVK